MEQVDYLFVDKALAGLRKNSVTDVETIEQRFEKEIAVRRESVGALQQEPKM